MSTNKATRRRAAKTAELLYQPAPWLICRTPLLPAAGPGAARTSNPREALADPRVRRALAIGSPDLMDALQRPGAGWREQARAGSKLARYLIRMSTRPTPYGGFAAVSFLGWGAATTLRLCTGDDRLRTRPDMGWLIGLCTNLDADPNVRADSQWMVSPQATQRDGRLYLADGAGQQGSVRLTAAVGEVVRAARRPIPYARLREHLLRHTSGSPEQVDRLLTQLWQSRLLVTDLRPRLTTASAADDLWQRLSDRASCIDTAKRLAALIADLSSFDGAPPEEASPRLRELTGIATALHPVSGPVAQTDLARPVVGEVNALVGQECARAAELLLRLSPEPLGSTDLQAYRQAFVARYGSQHEVALLDLLDPHTGLGPLGHTHGQGAGLDQQRATVIMDLALTAIRDRRRVVELTDETLRTLQTWAPSAATAPISLDLSAFVVAASAPAVDRGEFLLVIGPNLGASSAARSLGRFADILGPAATTALRQVGDAERRARPDAGQPVEVVYLPEQPRSANVVVRPIAHDREIVVNGLAGVAADRVIWPDDIMVGVRDNRFYLRSPSHGGQLRPTTRHMLNQHRAPAICRFLDEVAADGSPQFSSFDWGAASGFPYLPRVQYGKIVLSSARWLLRPAIDGPDGWTTDPQTFATHLRAWRAAWSVPATVYLSMADNRLLLDLTDPDQAEQLRAEARAAKAGSLRLEEALPDRSHAWVPGPDGYFMSELVVPLVLRPQSGAAMPHAHTAVRHRTFAAARPLRTRLPGSDWLFAKFYCSASEQNDLLTGPFLQLCEMAETSGLARQWFFVRYADPEPHLRLRWKGDPQTLIRHLLPEITRATSNLINDGLVSRLVIDTYDRELERYGGPSGTDLSEEIFWADSRAVIKLLAAVSADDLTDLAVATADDLLAGLGLAPEDRLRWYSLQIAAFTDNGLRRQAGNDYRNRQRNLRTLLGTRRGPTLLGNDVPDLLAQRQHALSAAAARLKDLEAAGQLTTPSPQLYGSYLHMHCNRLLGNRPPAEAHLLHLLHRTRKGLAVAPVS